jgi:hypothetical protein
LLGIGDVAAFVAFCSGREDKKAVGYREDEKTNRAKRQKKTEIGRQR